MHPVSALAAKRTARQASRSPAAHLVARAVIYAGFCYLTFTVIAGTDRSQSGRQQDVTATVLQHPAGRVLVGVAGLIVVGCGIALVVEGARRTFLRHLRTAEMSAGTQRAGELLGVTGTIARGLVFALAGMLVIVAAVTRRAAESGGIDKALLTLRDQPFGEVLMLLAALGLIAFGCYGLCEARWRKI